MSYFKNVELAAKHNISESTVRNWVKMAREGKLELALSEEKGKHYVANLPSNIPIIERLVEENKKYRNTRSAKTVTPKPEFYELFSTEQMYDIVRNLEIHHEIPRQYNYFDGGASEWDKYTEQLVQENIPNLLNRTVNLIVDNQGYLDKRLSKYHKVNVIDIGVGNARPAEQILTHLLEKGILGRYIAIDISPEMIAIAQRNIERWFGDKVTFEGHQLDITSERFANLLTDDYLNDATKGTANLVLLLGGTADNLRTPDDAFRTINESMNPNDLLLYSNKLETEDMRPEWFNYETKPGKLTLAPRHRIVFNLLNIDESFYDVEIGFDPMNNQRYARTRLTVALTLKFNFGDGERVLEFEKGDTLLLWRSWQMTARSVYDQFERTGFYTVHSSQAEDREYIITLSEVKR